MDSPQTITGSIIGEVVPELDHCRNRGAGVCAILRTIALRSSAARASGGRESLNHRLRHDLERWAYNDRLRCRRGTADRLASGGDELIGVDTDVSNSRSLSWTHCRYSHLASHWHLLTVVSNFRSLLRTFHGLLGRPAHGLSLVLGQGTCFRHVTKVRSRPSYTLAFASARSSNWFALQWFRDSSARPPSTQSCRPARTSAVGCSPVRRPSPTLRCDLDGVGRALGSGVSVAAPNSKTATPSSLCPNACQARFRPVISLATRGDGQKLAVYLLVAYGAGCRLRYPLPQTPAKVS